jgi:hypothetical protein
MAWPEVALAAVAAAQVVILAWIAAKQAQVKRDLNGTADGLMGQLLIMQQELHQGLGYDRPMPPPGVARLRDSDR